MTSELRIEIPFGYVPKARPRVGAVKTVMPERYKASRKDVAWLLVDARNRCGRWPLDGQYAIGLQVWVARPNGGDLDNLVGTIMDAGNGILWNDDCQVTEFDRCQKCIDKDRPRAVVTVRVIDPSISEK